MRDAEQVEAAFATIEETWGPVEVLVANAGITRDTLMLRMSEEAWSEVIDTNLTGLFRVTKRALAKMIRLQRGRVIFVSSVGAFIGSPGQANYAASKAGLVGMARSMAREVASRAITVNVVAPGLVDTDMLAALGEDRVWQFDAARSRWARRHRPEEVAEAVWASWPRTGRPTSPGRCCRSTAAWAWACERAREDLTTDKGADCVTSDEAFEKFTECAVEVLQVPADKVTKEARFAEDLDADSLDLVELVMALEESVRRHRRGDRARGHRDHRAGLRPDHRQALMLLGYRPRRPGRRDGGWPSPAWASSRAAGSALEALWDGLNGPPPDGERPVPRLRPDGLVRPQGGPPARPVRPVLGGRGGHGARATPASSTPTRDRSGVVMGTGVGGLETLAGQILVFGEKGPRRVSPRLVPMMMSNAGAAGVSIRLGWHGPSETITTACAAGTHASRHAARLVASGRCDVAIGGGAEAGMTGRGHGRLRQHDRPVDLGELAALRRPARRVRDHRGRGALVLEDLDHAVARGARIYAELAGAASTADAHHITAPLARRLRCRRLHGAGPGGRRGRGADDRPHQRPRHVDAAQRPGRGATPSPRCSAPPPRRSPPPRGSPVTAWRRPAPSRRWRSCSASPLDHPADRRATSSPIPRSPRRGRRRGPALGAGRGPVQLLRVRRPQRLPGPAASGLNPASKVPPPLPSGGDT